MISKRSYQGERHFLQDLEQSFNVLRARTAEYQVDKNGTGHCYVAGWNDHEAAAIYLLTLSGVRGNMFNDGLLMAKVREIGQKTLNPEWTGNIISSDGHAAPAITPAEFSQDKGATVTHQGEAIISGATGVAESSMAMQSIPTIMEGDPEYERIIDDRIHVDIPTKGSSQRHSFHDGLLELASEASVTIEFNKETWRAIKILALLRNVSPDECVEFLVSEAIKHYADPDSIARAIGGIFS